MKSERGASITFALLLFLVCAVISSIVIVAATTTSGRLSSLAKMDQRYYAVTSAAKLFSAMDNKTTVVQKKTVSMISTGEYGKTGELLEYPLPDYPIIYLDVNNLINNEPVAPQKLNIFQYAARCLICDNPNGETEEYFREKKFELTDKDRSYLDVEITVTLNAAGRLFFEIHNKTAGSQKYSLRLIFSSTISEKETESKTVEDKMTRVESTTVTWHLDSIETL